jgi:hypothetical protein
MPQVEWHEFHILGEHNYIVSNDMSEPQFVEDIGIRPRQIGNNDSRLHKKLPHLRHNTAGSEYLIGAAA